MIEIGSTNDIVLISVIQSLFDADGLDCFIADQHMSVLEGSTGFMRRRIMVLERDAMRARRLLADAGLLAELQNA